MIVLQPSAHDQAEAYALLFSLSVAHMRVGTLRQLERDLRSAPDVPGGVLAIAADVLSRAQHQAQQLERRRGGEDWRDRVRTDPAYAVGRIQALEATLDLIELGFHPPARTQLLDLVGDRDVTDLAREALNPDYVVAA